MTDKISKFLKALTPRVKKSLRSKLEDLKNAPFEMKEVKKLRGYPDLYRLRVGKIRIIYRVVSGEVEIVDIDFRGNVY